MKKRFTPRELRRLRIEAEQQYESIHGARFYRNVDFLLYIVVVIMAALVIRAFFVEPIRVDGDSMLPTLIDGEHMVVEKLSYWTRGPARGEIVICYYPGYTESCVKRVIGLPGDTVAVRNGSFYINGNALNESIYWSGDIIGDMEPVTVGEKEVFVVGDNRNGSKDSRAPSVGCIPYSKVVGRVTAVIWPLDEFKKMEKVEYPA